MIQNIVYKKAVAILLIEVITFLKLKFSGGYV